MGGKRWEEENFEWHAIERMKKDSTIDARICSPKCCNVSVGLMTIQNSAPAVQCQSTDSETGPGPMLVSVPP